ncbi:MAG: chemotaxis protein CheA [Desulfobacterales bacterium]
MIDYTMLQEFITETGEHLNEMETNLLRLETEPENKEFLNDIFREVHSIKGAAEYVGLEKMSELSHKLENLLENIRQGKTTVDSRIIDILIESRDRMMFLIRDLEVDKIEHTEIQDVLKRVREFSADDIGNNDPENSMEDRVNFFDIDFNGNLPGHEKPERPEDTIEDKMLPHEDEENYEEEYDAELFEIFLDQLKEHIFSIHEKIAELYHSEDPAALFGNILKNIDSLRSSANYMGYESLVGIYAGWKDEVKEALENIAMGISASYRFMEDYLEMILVRFPQVREVLTKAEDPVPENALRWCNDNTCEKEDADDLGFMEAVEKEFELLQQGASQDQETEDQKIQKGFLDFGDDSKILETSDKLSEEEVEQIDLVELDTLLDSQKLYENLDKAFEDALQNIYSPGQGGVVEEELFSPCQSVPDDLLMVDVAEESACDANDAITEKTNEHEIETEENIACAKADPDDVTQEVISRRQNELFDDRQIKKTLRVDSYKIDSLMNQVGELVVSRAWFSQLFSEMREFQQYLKENVRLEKKEMKQVRGLTFRLSEATLNLGRVANELQEGIMKVRMLPIAHLFNRYPRLVRDLVKGTDKNIRLEIKGEDTELDKMIIEEISDPLVHIIRNAVDHGIESFEKRRMLGKPDFGTVTLEAYHESNHVVIEIKDDGKGIDPEKIKQTALEKKIAEKEELDQLTSKEVFSLIMKPGFSTAKHVTHTSGRGVGMDVVKKNVEKLNGNIEIDSQPGKQTRFRIKIPLTLAIIPALLVRVGRDLFTIPLTNVEETLRIFASDTTTMDGTEVIYLRDTTLPLVRLSVLFNRRSASVDSDKQFVVVVSTGLRRVGLVVDALIGQEEVVIKPLVDYLQESSGFSGATILGDGTISLILDVYELVNLTIDRRIQQLATISNSA